MKTYKLEHLTCETFRKRIAKYDDFIKILDQNEYTLKVEWNNSMLGFWYEIEFTCHDNTVSYSFEMQNLIKWIIVALMVLLMIFRLNVFAYIVSSLLFVVFFWFLNHFFIAIAIEKMLIKLDRGVSEIFTEFDPAAKGENHCPACGAEITPYDSHCPDCGLYLGKAADQPVSRTSYTNYRINYQYKPKEKGKNQT